MHTSRGPEALDEASSPLLNPGRVPALDRHSFLRNQTPHSPMSASGDGSGKQNWMSLNVEQAFVHILACVFSVPELTKSLDRTTPTGEVIDIEEMLSGGVVGVGDDGTDSCREPDNGGVNCRDCLERNGVVTLSVRNPLKREITASMMPYNIFEQSVKIDDF